jgi:uncharacterized protein DUF5343
LEHLGFTSTNDRLFIGILKDLGFLNRDGAPQARYYEFLDGSRSKQVLASGIREAFADLFAINVHANAMGVEEVRNKLRTLYAGKKTDLVIGNISKTFKALCELVDFSDPFVAPEASATRTDGTVPEPSSQETIVTSFDRSKSANGKISVASLQYHINIVLPDTRDQAVYDAIFKSLREHLG